MLSFKLFFLIFFLYNYIKQIEALLSAIYLTFSAIFYVWKVETAIIKKIKWGVYFYD